ncbi:MAG: 30S ribosomal protein S19e [Candidatus Micrarchaeaceae archaeon]
MSNVLEADGSKLIEKVAEKLKSSGVEKPDYLDYVKSGAGRERVPEDENFWYIRCASILRQTYLNGHIGVSRLRSKYSNRKKHVVHRRHSIRSGGSIITDAFTALEKIGYVKKTTSGREITPKGRSFLDKLAGEVIKEGA